MEGTPFTINRYDTAAKQWLPNDVAEPPIALRRGCVAHNDSHIFMVDGWGSTELSFVHIQVYDIARDAWTAYKVVADWTTGWYGYISWRYQYCYYVRDRLFVFGGRVGDSDTMYLDGIWRYEIGQEYFTRIGMLPGEAAYGMAVYDGYDHIYLVGGWSWSIDYTNVIRPFNINTGSLSEQVIYATHDFCCSVAVVVGTQLWIFGGELEDQEVTDTVQICDISSFVPTNALTTSTFGSTTEDGSSFEPVNANDMEQQQQQFLIYAICGFVAALCCCIAALVFYLRTVRSSSEKGRATPAVRVAKKAAPPSALDNMHGSDAPLRMYSYPPQRVDLDEDEKADELHMDGAVPATHTATQQLAFMQNVTHVNLSNIVHADEDEDDETVMNDIEMNMINGPSTRA